jgi:general secretion pathway protein G
MRVPSPGEGEGWAAISLSATAIALSFFVVAMGGMAGGLFFLLLHAVTAGALIAGGIAYFRGFRRKIAIATIAVPLMLLFSLYLFWVGGDPTPRLTQSRAAASTMAMVPIRDALKQFQIDNARLPTTGEGLDALLNAPIGLERTWNGPYIPTDATKDAWEQPLNYRHPAKRNSSGYDLFSSGRDGIPDTSDDVKSP